VDANNGTIFHPDSWNSNASIFFIDQPIGVGFSHTEYGETVVCGQRPQNIASGVQYFGRAAPKRRRRTSQHSSRYSLPISASSRAVDSTCLENLMPYAQFLKLTTDMEAPIFITQGRYPPVFASAIYDQNPLLVEAGLHPINLTSVIIGNGFTDGPTMMSSLCALRICTLVPLVDPSWLGIKCSVLQHRFHPFKTSSALILISPLLSTSSSLELASK
jgi:hypothetical protein